MITVINTTSVLKINGMKCENCAGRVKKAVQSLAGVNEVAINLEAKTATVTYDASQIDLAGMAAAIENLGHGYEVIKE